VKWMGKKENTPLGRAQELGRVPRSKLSGFCRHKVACLFSLLFVDVEKPKSHEETGRNFGKLSY